MNVVLDTNVFLAGVFFSGPPATILRAWREGRITLVVSPPIMDEYRRVMHELAEQFPAVDPGPPLELLAVHARLVEASPLPEVVCTDPTDDMFLACAIAGGSRIIVSGDKALLRTSGYRGIEVLTPRAFLSHI
ncbi:MAG: putative toxin-antitoxin system toxin component, PIN family [Lentisphaeria bacterium]